MNQQPQAQMHESTANLPIQAHHVNASFWFEEVNVPEFDRMSIAEFERSGDSSELWVLNTSSGNFAGAISFTAHDDSGEARGLEVPYTFVAINLAERMAPDRILRSTDFRRAVSRGFITIIKPERARLQNSGTAARLELNKISQGISVGVAESAETMGGVQSHAQQISVSSGSNINGGTEQVAPENMVDTRIQRVMLDENISEDEKLNFLRSNRDSIKLVDALYVRRCATADDADELFAASKKMVKTLKARAMASNPNTDWSLQMETANKFARKAMHNL